MCLLNSVFSETAISIQRFHNHDLLLASSPVPHWYTLFAHARKMRGHDKVLITGVASEFVKIHSRYRLMKNSRSSRFTAMPATVLCQLCSRTAGQQFTELYYYVICSTDMYGRYPISPENLGNLEHAQSVYTRPSFMRYWG